MLVSRGCWSLLVLLMLFVVVWCLFVVVYCSLFVVCCYLLIGRCLLFAVGIVVCRVMFVVGCCLIVAVLFTACGWCLCSLSLLMLFVAGCLLLADSCVLRVVC